MNQINIQIDICECTDNPLGKVVMTVPDNNGCSNSINWVWTIDMAKQHLKERQHYYWGADHKFFIAQ